MMYSWIRRLHIITRFSFNVGSFRSFRRDRILSASFVLKKKRKLCTSAVNAVNWQVSWEPLTRLRRPYVLATAHALSILPVNSLATLLQIRHRSDNEGPTWPRQSTLWLKGFPLHLTMS